MVRLLGALAVSIAALLPGALVIDTPLAAADRDVQPIVGAQIPNGPAPAWIVADLDSGQILAGRDEYVTHPPASTIKVLLALVVLDELPLDATVVASEADANVECNCVGVTAGHVYTTQELLDGLLLVSGNDAANTLAHMLGGMDVAVAKMNVKAAAARHHGHAGRIAIGSQRARHRRLHDTARPRRHLPRRAGQPRVQGDHVIPNRTVPR